MFYLQMSPLKLEVARQQERKIEEEETMPPKGGRKQGRTIDHKLHLLFLIIEKSKTSPTQP